MIVLAAFSQSLHSAINADNEVSPAKIEAEAQKLAAQWNGESLQSAIVLFLRAGDEFKKLGNFQAAAQSLRRTARLQDIVNEREKALATAKRAVELNPKLSHLDAIKNLTLYVRYLIANGEPAKAQKILNKARELAAAANDPAADGYVFRSAAEIYESKGEFAEAEASHVKAVEMFRQRDDEKVLANALMSLAGTRIATGKYILGLENADEAKGLFLESGEPRNINRAKVIRGHLLNMLGRKQEALDEYLEAEKMFPVDIDGVEKARLQNGIGYVYQELGELGLALSKRREAFQLFDKVGYRPGVQITLPLLIDLSFKLGDESAAFEYLRTSEGLAAQDKYYPGLAASHSFVGDHYFRMKENDLAISYYRRALPVFQRAKLPLAAANIHDKLGSVLVRLGENSQARKQFERSLSINREIHNRQGETNTLYNLAGLELKEGRLAEALKLSQASVDGTEKLSAEVRNTRLRSSHFASVSERYELLIRLLMMAAEKNPDPKLVEKALQAAERSRARSMLEKLSMLEASVTADAPPDILAAEKELLISYNAASDRLANLVDSAASRKEIDDTDRDIREIEQRIEQLRATAKITSPVYSGIKDPSSLNVEDLRRDVIKDDSLVLEYWLGREKSYLWVVDNNGLSAHALPGRQEIEGRIASIRDLIAANETRVGETVEAYQERIASSEKNYRTQARELSKVLLGPAGERIKNKRIIIVADGALHSLPFSAIPLPDTKTDEPLLNTNEVIYQPSAQTLLLLAKIETRENENRRDLIVFSDPVFSSDDERLTGVNIAASQKQSDGDKFRLVESLRSLTRLRGSEREADLIIQTVGSSADRFEGFAASRDAFLGSDLSGYKILHIATHARADTERPDLSGIVFSRFAEKGELINEMVRLQDIYSLRLNCDLVVLSACETAVGKDLKGEGVLSLNNAFLQAGSKTVLSSLWKVEDEAARTLMTNFYRGITDDRLTPSESLKRAQTSLMQEPRFRSPFYWAAFTVHGKVDVRPHIAGSRSTLSFSLKAFAVALLVVGLACVAYRRRKNNLAAD